MSDNHAVQADFLSRLQSEAAKLSSMVSMEDGDWIVKGFIDVFRNVYTISGDTKVVSKLIELMLFPQFVQFAIENDLKLVPSREQNHYPDMTFIDELGNRFAVDLKSTYRTGKNRVNTMTLGAFTGYFRNRESMKNVTFPYGSYAGHYVLGVIYSRSIAKADEFRQYGLDDLESIPSVVRDLEFFAQPKFRIASYLPGSGNTKNIGGVNQAETLINGMGPFAELGEEVFDDYWMFYLTGEMARTVELSQSPYRNLATYLLYKQLPVDTEKE